MIKEIKLTEEQQKVADAIESFLNEPNTQVFTLKGVGGAGKTTVLKAILKDYNNIVAATVSHVAKSVLETVIGDIAECMTIAKLLNMRQSIDEDGEITFLPRINDVQNFNNSLPIETADILVIDECSMIDDFIFNLILRYKKPNSKILMLGDPYQLSPVSYNNTDRDSITFNHTKAELLKSVRYGGIISDLGNRIRKEIDKINSGKAGSKYLLNEWSEEIGNNCRTSQVDENGNGIIFLNNIQDVIRITKLHNQTNKDNINELRLIGYRRKTINLINKEMRIQLYKDLLGNIPYEDFPQFIPGEIVINDGGYKNGLVHNNESFKAMSFKPITGPYDVPCLALKLSPDPTLNYQNQQIIVLDEKLGKVKYNAILNELKSNAQRDKRQWKEYYKFKESFCVFEYAISLNSHRA